MSKWTEARRKKVSRLVRCLCDSVKELEQEFGKEGRKFTLDGHLVGSIGEVVAASAFNLELLKGSAKTHDAKKGKKLIQIKLTTGKRGVALYEDPDYLIVLQLQENKFKVIYDGPGSVAVQHCGKKQKNGQRQISLRKLRALNQNIPDSRRVKQVRALPKL